MKGDEIIRPKLPRRDARGKRLHVGDVVRIIGVPDLSGVVDRRGRAECRRVFRYLVGKYKKIAEFDEYGQAGLWFHIREGRDAGIHWVAIEPHLLRLRIRRG